MAFAHKNLPRFTAFFAVGRGRFYFAGSLRKRLFLSGAAEAAFGSCGFAEFVCRFKFGFCDGGEDHLRYAVSGLYREVFFSEVYQDYSDFAAVVGVYCAGRVEDGDAVLEGEALRGRTCAS